MKKIEWVIFDIGNVVLDIDVKGPVRYLNELSGLDSEIIESAFRDEFHLSDDGGSKQGLYERLQTGQVTGDEFIEHVHESLAGRIPHAEIKTAVMSVIVKERDDTLTLIKDLDAHYNIACYSNTHEIHWDNSLVNLQSFDYFEAQMASHLSGFAKPDDRAYQHMIEQTKASADKILFVDDIAVNVTAAQRNGMHSVQFSHADDVRDYLKSL